MRAINDIDIDHMIKFDIEGKGEDTYFMTVNQAEKEVKGVFMVNAYERHVEATINVIIQSPDEEVLFAQTKRSFGKFSFNSTVSGEYKLIFSNLQSTYDKGLLLGIYNQEESE